MRRLLTSSCVLLAAMLITDGTASAQRGQGRGQGQPRVEAPVGRPETPSPRQPRTSGERGRPERNQSASEALRRNPRLAESVQDLLPGQNLDTAASGFRNTGQFIAAAHVAHNLGIPFSELKSRMVDRDMSLGEAIKDLRPDADSRGEARKAEAAARERMSRAERIR